MTFTQQVDLGGLIPKSIVNGQAVNQLMYLSTIRMRFDRSLEMDKGVRKLNVAMIQDHSGEYSEEEKNILAAGEKHFADFREMRAKSLKLKSPLARAEIAYKSGDRHAWGWSSTIVRASPKEVRAPYFCSHRSPLCSHMKVAGARVPLGHHETLGATRGRPREGCG